MEGNPASYTHPLSDDFTSLWDKYAKIITVIWLVAFRQTLDPWQAALIRAVLETYPPGHPRAGQLRYRQVVISLPRQVGKTEIAAILGLIGLLRLRNTVVIGIASSREQAALIYKRTLAAITANASLKKRFKRLTDTRGIQGLDGSSYELKAAKGVALQGIPVMTGVVDELHVLKAELWDALVSGLGGRPNGLIIGITTAGDDDSELLKRLYKVGYAAVAGDPSLESFGFFLWEAPESEVPDSDDELLEYLMIANPALACGRLDPDLVLADIRAKEDHDIIRYHLNRFIESVTSFVPLTSWGKSMRTAAETFPRNKRPVFAIDVSPSWNYATVTVAVKDEKEVLHTEVVASLVKPSLTDLIRVCKKLAKHNPRYFAMDSYALKSLASELKKLGLPVYNFSLADHLSGTARFGVLAKQGKIKHKGDPLLTIQMPGTIRTKRGEAYRLSARDASAQIDAVISTMTSVYVADILQEEPELQLW